MKKQHVVLLAAWFLLFVFGSGFVYSQEKSLYQRLGGYDAIAAVTDDFIGRLATDPTEGRFLSDMVTIQNNVSASTLSINCAR